MQQVLEVLVKLKDELSTEISGIQKQFNSLSQTISSIGKTATIMSAAFTGAVGVMMHKSIAYTESLKKMSAQIGVSTKDLQGMAFAADQNGSSVEELSMGMRQLAFRMKAANEGSAEAKERFDRLGVSVADINGNLRPLEEVLLDVSDRFKQSGDSSTLAAQAMELFGRQGATLIPFLKLGAAGIKEFMAKAEELGIILDHRAIELVDRLGDSFSALKTQALSLSVRLTETLAPTLIAITEEFQKAMGVVIKWVKENKEIVKTILLIGGAIAGILGTIGSFAVAMTALSMVMTAFLIPLGLIAAKLLLLSPLFLTLGGVIAAFAVQNRNTMESAGKSVTAYASVTADKFSKLQDVLNFFINSLKSVALFVVDWGVGSGIAFLKFSGTAQKAVFTLIKTFDLLKEQFTILGNYIYSQAKVIGDAFMNLPRTVELAMLAIANATGLATEAQKARIIELQNLIAKEGTPTEQLAKNNAAALSQAGESWKKYANVVVSEADRVDAEVKAQQKTLEGYGEQATAAVDAASVALKQKTAELTTTVAEAGEVAAEETKKSLSVSASYWDQFVGGLKQSFGGAMDDFVARTFTFRQQLVGLFQTMQSSLSNAFERMISGGAKWSDAMKTFYRDVKKAFIKMMTDMFSQQIMKGAMQMLQAGGVTTQGGGGGGQGGGSSTDIAAGLARSVTGSGGGAQGNTGQAGATGQAGGTGTDGTGSSFTSGAVMAATGVVGGAGAAISASGYKKGNVTKSTTGGAMQGAAMGMAVAGPWGALVGAIIGAAVGFYTGKKQKRKLARRKRRALRARAKQYNDARVALEGTLRTQFGGGVASAEGAESVAGVFTDGISDAEIDKFGGPGAVMQGAANVAGAAQQQAAVAAGAATNISVSVGQVSGSYDVELLARDLGYFMNNSTASAGAG